MRDEMPVSTIYQKLRYEPTHWQYIWVRVICCAQGIYGVWALMQLLIHQASALALLEDEQKFKLGGGCWRPLFPILAVNLSGITWTLHHVPCIFYLFLTSAISFGWVVVVGDYIPKIRKNGQKPRPAGRPGTSTKCATSSVQKRKHMFTKSINQGLQVGLMKWTERPSTRIKGPTCSTYPDLLGRSTTMDFMHPLINMSVKRRAEMCQLQAGRPHFAVSRVQLRVEVTSTVLVAYNTRTHLVPTLEHYK